MSNIYSILLIVIIVIIISYGLRSLFLNYTKVGKEYKSTIQKDIFNQDAFKSLFDDLLKETKIINEESEEVLTKINNELINTKINQSISHNDMMQFKCVFDLNLPYELKECSSSFFNLLSVSSINELQEKYDRRVKKLDLNVHDLHLLNLKDVFELDKFHYEEIINTINKATNSSSNSTNTNKLILEDYNLEINTNLINSYIKVICNFYVDDNRLVVLFKIFNIISKINPYLNDMIESPIYKELITNLVIDLSYPLIIVNSKGIKFLNRSTCEWFGLDYNIIDNLQNIESGFIPINIVFDKIDKQLTYYIKDSISNTSLNDYTNEYILSSNESDKVCKTPIKIIVLIKPFINSNNKKELFVIMKKETIVNNNTDTITSSIDNTTNTIIEKKKDKSSTLITPSNSKEDKKNTKLNNVIKELTEYNESIKKVFVNTENIALGRINLKTKQVIVSNNIFENLILYGSNKDRYNKIIDNIVSSHDKLDNKFNFYSYDIMFTDKIIKILYTYYKDYADILLLENYMHRYISNNSLSALSNMYDISDLPIIIVNKKSEILSANSKFISLYDYESKQMPNNTVSLLTLVPDNDKNKVKRAISDAIKFNSNNLYDNITLLGKDKQYVCKLLCIKTYGKIKSEEFITITIFPSITD